MNQPTEADAKAAYEEACDAGKRVIKALFPDAFKRGRFQAGDCVGSGGNIFNLWTVIGYNTDKAAVAYYESIGGAAAPVTQGKPVLLVMKPGGITTQNRDDGWWTLHKD